VSNIHLLERSLRKLRLTRVGAEWHALEKRALAEGWTPSRYLLTLCNDELLWRESEKLRRDKKEARLPMEKTLGEYDFAQVPEMNAAQFRQLCETTDWVDAGENVLLFGASGQGKSHLAAAIVDGVVDQGYRARFYSAGELLQELRKARAQRKLNELLLKLDRYRVIVVMTSVMSNATTPKPVCCALTQHFCYPTRTVASPKLLLWLCNKQSVRGAPMSNALLPMDTRRQLLRAQTTRYQAASKAEKTRILEEFILISGYHRKSAIRLLNGAVTSDNQRRRSATTRSVYGAAVQQALIVLWEASDRLCGKRLSIKTSPLANPCRSLR